jgi:hypothetical protein
MMECRYCAIHSYCWQWQLLSSQTQLLYPQGRFPMGLEYEWALGPVIDGVEQRKINYVAPVGKRARTPRLSNPHFNHSSRYIGMTIPA